MVLSRSVSPARPANPLLVLARVSERRVPIAALYLDDDAMEAWYNPFIA